MSIVCLLYHADIKAASEEQADHTPHNTQNAVDTEKSHQPAEGDEEQEAKHKVDQSQDHDNNNSEVSSVQLQHQQGTVLDQEGTGEEDKTPRDSRESEDTEQVETFFSTMSHRYDNANLEAHIS